MVTSVACINSQNEITRARSQRVGMNAAREKIRVAHALGKLPGIDGHFAKGELGYSKVRAMTRIADERNEDYLLMVAKHGTAHHVEKLVSKYRRAKHLQDAERANELESGGRESVRSSLVVIDRFHQQRSANLLGKRCCDRPLTSLNRPHLRCGASLNSHENPGVPATSDQYPTT